VSHKKRKTLLKKKFLSQESKGFSFWSPKIFIILGILFLIIIIANIFGAVTFEKIYEYYSRDLPEVNIKMEDYPAITRLYDRGGSLLLEETGDEERIYTKVEDVSQYLLKAILTAEDQYFFSHSGIDFWANARALWQNLFYGRVISGASTITQQLATNFFLTRDVSYSRKIKEMILAREIEKKYSKKEILEFYLNKIPFGSNIYGVEAASRAFFGKSAHFLTLAEAATLAPIPRSPNRLFPYKYPQELLKKKEQLLALMKNKKIISDLELEKALQEKIEFKKEKREIFAPHFSFYVLDKVKEAFSTEATEKGLEIITTIDLGLQDKIDAILKQTIDKYKKPYLIDNGAAVVIDASNGDILAMSGSYDFFQEDYGQHNSAISLRQPGSTLKPFLYSLAIQDFDWTKKTILEDKPMDFNGYKPKDFSGHFRGKVTLESALVNSLNLPAVATLEKLGIKRFRDALASCHLNLDENAGLSMAIGGASASLLDVTSAYTAFVNEGKCFKPNYFARVKQSDGKILVSNPEISSSQVFAKEAIDQVDSILKKSLNNFNATKQFMTDPLLKDAGVKTGTSNGPRDFWAIGYNSGIIVGIWLGNHDNSLLKANVDSVQLAVPLWADIMRISLTNKPKEIVSSFQE
jgi:penicillin-binding protein 1C